MLTDGTRCDDHRRVLEQRRGGRRERGYGADHVRIRAALERTLPAPCFYCGRVIHPGEPWNAAHVVDGQPEFGEVVAHPACNQGARARRT